MRNAVRSALGADALPVTTSDARRLFMASQGLLEDPAVQARSPASLLRLIERMGFVQIDTINTVDRAHHLILASRSDAYCHAWLDTLSGAKRKLFEHWTHDASFIPTRWFAHWRPRFERYRARGWHRDRLGDDADALVARVLERVRAEGPLRSADFEHVGDGGANGWWNWKPHKVALEYLWRTGDLYVVGRQNFHKIYDLTERAVPEHHAAPAVSDDEHIAWACERALERLGIATASEVTNFWRAISLAQATAWLDDALRRGRVVAVQVVSPTSAHPPRRGYALPDVQRTLRRLHAAPRRARLLCPFDPVLRDRARLKRLFDFDHRFEGFVPAPKRRFGYYVMPILCGERLIGRVDPKFSRDEGLLRINRVWWEPNLRPDARVQRELTEACERLASFLGASRVEFLGARA